MKIVFISGSYPPMLDGVGDYTYRLSQEMKRQIGWDNVYVITSEDKMHRNSDPNVFFSIGSWDLHGVSNILGIINSIEPHVVHIQYPSNSFGRSLGISLLPLLLRMRWPRIKIFCTIHEFNNKTPKGKFRLVLSMLSCHGIVVVSESFRNSISRYCPFVSRRITYIPIGSNIAVHKVGPKRKHEIRRSLGWKEADPVLVYFGILRDGKGLCDLVDAYLAALGNDCNLKLLVVGGQHSECYGNNITAKLRGFDAGENIVITGRVTEQEVSEYLAIADVCVLPYEDGVSTKRGGFMAAVEHELPIITTNPSTKINELYHAENIMLVPAGDVQELVNKIQILVREQKTRQTIRRNVADLKRFYSWKLITQRICELYQFSGTH